MKKWIAFMLSLILMINVAAQPISMAEETIPDFLVNENFDFDSLDDPMFLQYLEDSIYANLEGQFVDSESMYQIEDISAIYISKEYLEETAYNTKANIFFGYNLTQINDAFQGAKYVFTLSDDGETVVQEFVEFPDDTYNRIINNVLIGAGVILICVTVSVLTAGTAVPAVAASSSAVTNLVAVSTVPTAAKVHLIFAASAKTATAFATKGALFAGATTLVTRGIETGFDMDAMAESAAVNSSEAFKWGAISGAVIGGGKEALRIHKIKKGPLSPKDAEDAVFEKYNREHSNARKQVTYLNGKEVPYATPSAVRPDVVVANEAIEVKCYDLTKAANLYELRKTLSTEIAQRVVNLPDGMTQRIVLNVEGRGYSAEFVNHVVEWVHGFMQPIYPDIPIDVMGAVL